MSLSSAITNISVGKKLAGGFVSIVLLTAVIALISINTLDQYHDRSQVVALVSSAESALLLARADEKNFLIRREAKYINQAKAESSEAAQIVGDLKSRLVVPADLERIRKIVGGVDDYHDLLDKLVANIEAGDETIRRIETEIRDSARKTVALAVELQEVQVQRMEEQFDSALTTLIMLLVGVVAIATAIGWILTRSITTPINTTVSIANRVASGDLTVDVPQDRSDEFGQLLAALAMMISGLRDLVQQISSSASNIASASEELSSVTDHSSEGVARQKDQTDQVATAMNEMVATVSEVAKSAEAAFEAANRASAKSTEGEKSVHETLEFVTDLNTQIEKVSEELRSLQSETHNIGTVLDVIKSVAEQTNLLALNAAIEAARAGEQGRGFAVVADEVRSLAQRTQSSASEIETLINNLVASAESSVTTMESGAKLAAQTLERAEASGNIIKEMAAAVEEIRQHNSQIATAAEQQTSVAEDINQNITEIRDVSDQSATSANQVSSSSDELAKLAEGLSSQIARFKV
jgi:methyl-accepting chemotaxis protein